MNVYDDFMNRFSVKHVEPIRGPAKYTNYSNFSNRTGYDSYDIVREELVEMELTRFGFEQLVRQDCDYYLLQQNQQNEEVVRRENPVVAEAYSKYRMLLELYK